MILMEAFLEILRMPTIGDVIIEMLMFLGPVWIAFFAGIILGWAWKPRWVSFGNSKFVVSTPSSPSASVAFPVKNLDSTITSTSGFGSSAQNITFDKEQILMPLPDDSSYRSSCSRVDENVIVTDEDVQHLRHLVERKDGGPPWKHIMDRSTPSMTYQAWQRDIENGPPQYCSKTVYEDATPELLRDFFWDDDFRKKWDDMLLDASTIDECPTTGTMIVHWIRKFPFFCSDREYTIGRRIWESGSSYYCVTKATPCSSIPRKHKPKRVDTYYSSWYIQPVESRKGDGHVPACEVILFHHEDMGIPWEIAKFGVRQGMWGAAKKVERGYRTYQRERASGSPLSRPAFLAQINTIFDPDYLEEDEGSKETEMLDLIEKPRGLNIPKLFIIGGAVMFACSLDRGLLAKGLIFGAARRFANIGRRVTPTT